MLSQSIEFEDKLLDIYDPRVAPKEQALAKQQLPVLYVLDGNAYGPLLDRGIFLQGRNTPKTKVATALIVAIGYPQVTAFQPERRGHDYTPKRCQKELNDKHRKMPEGGGIAEFQEQIARIHQFICEKYSVDETKVGLYGHSLGGLFVLESLLSSEKVPFITDYLAVSPSLWWDQFEYFNKLARIDLPKEKRIGLAVENDCGEMEESAEKAYHIFCEEQQISEVFFSIEKDENHMSVVFSSLSKLLRWFFKGEEIA